MVLGVHTTGSLVRDSAEAQNKAPANPRGMAHLGNAADDLVRRQQDLQRQHHIEEARKVLDQRSLDRNSATFQARAEAQAQLEQGEAASRQKQRTAFLYRADADLDEEEDEGSFIPETEQGAGAWSWFFDIPETLGCGECCQPQDMKGSAQRRWVAPRAVSSVMLAPLIHRLAQKAGACFKDWPPSTFRVGRSTGNIP